MLWRYSFFALGSVSFKRLFNFCLADTNIFGQRYLRCQVVYKRSLQWAAYLAREDRVGFGAS